MRSIAGDGGDVCRSRSFASPTRCFPFLSHHDVQGTVHPAIGSLAGDPCRDIVTAEMKNDPNDQISEGAIPSGCQGPERNSGPSLGRTIVTAKPAEPRVQNRSFRCRRRDYDSQPHRRR
jgi:hypothetical protein